MLNDRERCDAAERFLRDGVELAGRLQRLGCELLLEVGDKKVGLQAKGFDRRGVDGQRPFDQPLGLLQAKVLQRQLRLGREHLCRVGIDRQGIVELARGLGLVVFLQEE